MGAMLQLVAGLGHAFHILVITLRAFIFMMLTIVYLSMSAEHHRSQRSTFRFPFHPAQSFLRVNRSNTMDHAAPRR